MRRRAAMHYASIGALLFALTRGPGADGTPAPIELRFDATAADAPHSARSAGSEIDGASDEAVLYRAALARHLDRDDPVVQARLVQNMRFLAGDASDAAALYRGAVDLGMADGDLIVRRRLVERMRLLLQQSALADEPGDDVLQAYLDAHVERFATPPRVRLVQIFLSRRRGAGLAADAARLLARLGPDDVARAAALGDALPLPAALPPASAHDLARLFGDDFATAALALAPERWQGPLPSPYGLHLAWVAARWPATVPALAEVREQIRAAVREERAAAALRDAVDALRAGAGGAAAGR